MQLFYEDAGGTAAVFLVSYTGGTTVGYTELCTGLLG